ncbi:MAG: hypothetical protein U1D30_19630 [Planctomycetota bacterium]
MTDSPLFKWIAKQMQQEGQAMYSKSDIIARAERVFRGTNDPQLLREAKAVAEAAGADVDDWYIPAAQILRNQRENYNREQAQALADRTQEVMREHGCSWDDAVRFMRSAEGQRATQYAKRAEATQRELTQADVEVAQEHMRMTGCSWREAVKYAKTRDDNQSARYSREAAAHYAKRPATHAEYVRAMEIVRDAKCSFADAMKAVRHRKVRTLAENFAKAGQPRNYTTGRQAGMDANGNYVPRMQRTR